MGGNPGPWANSQILLWNWVGNPWEVIHSLKYLLSTYYVSISGGLDGKESACNAGDSGSTPGWGRFPGENGFPLQYSCMEHPMDRGVRQAAVHGVAKSWTQQRLTLLSVMRVIIVFHSFPLSTSIYLSAYFVPGTMISFHSFIQQVFTEYLLRASHRDRWQTKHCHCPGVSSERKSIRNEETNEHEVKQHCSMLGEK